MLPKWMLTVNGKGLLKESTEVRSRTRLEKPDYGTEVTEVDNPFVGRKQEIYRE